MRKPQRPGSCRQPQPTGDNVTGVSFFAMAELHGIGADVRADDE
jgi:hypothetical protein